MHPSANRLGLAELDLYSSIQRLAQAKHTPGPWGEAHDRALFDLLTVELLTLEGTLYRLRRIRWRLTTDLPAEEEFDLGTVRGAP